MSHIYKFFILELSILFVLSEPLCTNEKNNCLKCNPITNLCSICEKDIFTPDDKGGCVGAKKCSLGQNYCIECNDEQNSCKTCDIGYFPDENGGCSFSDNCKISYKGECLECKENFELIESHICKSKYTDDLKNCKIINKKDGYCETCEDGFYLNAGDKKCTKVNNCTESIFGICVSCIEGYYLDVSQEKCLTKNDKFLHCKSTVDGEDCDQCDKGYYFAEDGVCVNTNFCSKTKNNEFCKKCMSGYYLTEKSTCANVKNCYFSDSDIGFCKECLNNFYLDLTTGECKSNQKNNDLKYCKIKKEGCIECAKNFFLGEDNKCSSSPNCKESELGVCKTCSEKYYLGLDNKCIDVEHCIYSDDFNTCTECEDNYYYNRKNKTCSPWGEDFRGCKESSWFFTYCASCKLDYYLNNTDHLCYSNTEEGDYYKCESTSLLTEKCQECILDYYLNAGDKRCSKILGCKTSENPNKCLECDEYYCLDVKNNSCVWNFYPENEDQKIYYRCNRTNEEGTKCEECAYDYLTINKEGLCFDKFNCEKEIDGECVKCTSQDSEGYFNCLNKDYGCVQGFVENCLRCDDILDFSKCTECIEGYELNQSNDCVLSNSTEV